MKKSFTLLLVSALVSGAATGCWIDGERHIAWDRARATIGPIKMKSRVVYVDSGRDRVIVIDLEEETPRLRTHRIGRNAIFATPAPDREQLAIITRGEEALVEGQVDEQPMLWLVDISAEADQGTRSYPLGSPFDRLSIASGGQTAVAYFSAEGFDSSSGVLRNPNELAVVDLTREADDDNPVLRSVRSFGAAPDGIILSPPMVIPGATDTSARVFAFILSLNTLTILDTANPERLEVSIRLNGTGEDVVPREIVFAPNSATAYVRSDNARDILAIFLHSEEPETERDNDYQPLLAELGAGAGPADIAVYDDAGGRRMVIAAMPGVHEVAVIDGDTAQFVTVETPDGIDRILLYPNDSDVPPRTALLGAIGQAAPRVHLLSLDAIRDELVPIDLRSVTVAEPVRDLVQIPGVSRAMVVHDDDRTVLGLLDVRVGSVSPLEGVGRLDSYDFDQGGQFLVGVTRSAERVGFLDLDSLHPSDMRLDDQPQQVFSLSSGAVFVDHGDPAGRATIMPSIESERADSIVLSGFLLTGILDERF